jgi:hypothetical protein
MPSMWRHPLRPSRSTVRHLELRIADFYQLEASQRAPDRVLEAAIATIDTTAARVHPRAAGVSRHEHLCESRNCGGRGDRRRGDRVRDPGFGKDAGPVGALALPDIVATEANVPVGLTVHRTVRGVEALRASGVVPADVAGLMDAIETSFDAVDFHPYDRPDLLGSIVQRMDARARGG